MALKIIKLASAFVLILLAALATVLFFVDPNSYKDLIQQKAKQSIGIDIAIEGDISWSLYPIGFDLNGLSLFDQNGALFTRIDSIQLALDTISLLRWKPEIEGVYASGANIVLKTSHDGRNNWDTLLDTSSIKPSTTATAPKNEETPTNGTNPGPTTLLFIPAQHVHLNDFKIQYYDALNGRDILVSALDLEINGVTLGQGFPLSMSYQLSSDALSLSYAHDLSTRIELSTDLRKVRLTDLINNVDASGAFGRNRAVKLSLTGDLDFYIDQKELVAHNVQISGAGLAVDTNFKLSGAGAYPHLQGNLSVAPFALASINKHLSLDLGVNNQAFRSVRFHTPFELKNNKLTLPTFDLGIDNSQFIGRLGYHTINRTLDLNIKGDNLDVDRYLAALEPSHAPLAFQQSRTVFGAIASPDSASTNQANQKPLLPLEIMRDMDAEITVTQDSLRYSNFLVSDIQLNTVLRSGVLFIEQLDARAFEGALKSKGTVTLSNTPSWQFGGSLTGLDLKPLNTLSNSSLPFSVDGSLNASFALDARGNSIIELLSQNQGRFDVDVSEGALNNLNLDRYMCEGIAVINREKLSQKWESDTHFKTLTSKNVLLNGVLNTNSINIETPSLQAYGTGRLALASTNFSYQLAVKPLGIPSDSACLVNAKYANLEIPLQCSGSLSEENSPLNCALNKQRISALMEQLARDETNRKVEKELDRGFDKKIGEYIDKDSELGKQLKKSILSIFN
ncbi:hypothetical protein A3742_04095 [Oleiphilus sp. HI0071]|uniref:AsmA family protein n=1 Tax=Oleiphilus sp. HI0080 TaxID=1822255 RepID=UPI0007C26ABD|nr:AsmA family protein [Oleiphilus sp. HI0080]KZY74778.1 hypothetical protein A3737_00430 [Oleiphilus sp. HI0065]KZY87101.1 hypothetical protein A3742_04095 [Oleiphilus sp. HI0071]KZY91269.1 hypothetical protein A3744_05285 [Oleiphilus sp. HI0073]KZZ60260.1 hypothetical protein A3760_05140 [Oleiphilus sp. HI0122]KZZ82098.1 hypothetical protein A3767_06290 [Oleiphilus sp. HI0133]